MQAMKMTPTMAVVLLAMQDGDSGTDVVTRSELAPAYIYNSLPRLIELGIFGYEAGLDERGRAKRVIRLTVKGKKVKAAVKRLQDVLEEETVVVEAKNE